MAAQPGIYQASHNAGEIGPEMWGRTDVKQWYSALSYARNVEPVPQAGARLSQRTRHLSRLRRKLSTLSASVIALNAGPHSGAATIAEIDLGGLVEFCRAWLPDFSASVATGAILQWQHGLADGNYTDFGDPFEAGPDALTRTIALAPGDTIAARRVRLQMVSAPPASVTFTVSALLAAAETSEISAIRLRPFTFGLGQNYVAAIGENNIDYFRDGVFVGGVAIGLTAAQLRDIDVRQRFDTMLLYHEDTPSPRIKRNGSDNDWILDAQPNVNIPQVDLGGTYENAVTDVWEIYLRYPTSGTYANGAGLLVSVKVGEEETAGIATGAPDWTQFKASLKSAIEGLPSIEEGVTLTEDHSSGGLTKLILTFSGTGNVGAFNVTARVVNTGDAAATVAHTTIGKAGGEPLTSEVRGYAACANFYQDRLFTGGFKSKLGAFLASVTGEYFDQNIESVAPNGAILNNLDTDGSERLVQIARSRHLVLFTTEAEYFISDRAINKTQPLNVVNCSRNGVARGVPVVESEGYLFYFTPDREDDDRKGRTLYSMIYDDVSQAYVSDPISLMASHIVKEVIGSALQKGNSATDANRLWMVRDNGTMTTCVMIRNQDVSANVRWETPGAVKDVCVDGANKPHIAVVRAVDGQDELLLERLEHGLIFDGTIEREFDEPTDTIDMLEIHEGAEVWAKADGFVVGPFTVENGAITLPFAASVVAVGRWLAPIADTLPLPSEVGDRTVLKRPRRVHTVKMELIDTTSIAIGANDEAVEDQPLYFDGQPTDTPPPPFNGQLSVEGIEGYSDDGIVRITQTRPGRLQWRGLTVEARL